MLFILENIFFIIKLNDILFVKPIIIDKKAPKNKIIWYVFSPNQSLFLKKIALYVKKEIKKNIGIKALVREIGFFDANINKILVKYFNSYFMQN